MVKDKLDNNRMTDTRKDSRVLLLGIISLIFLILPYCISIYLSVLRMYSLFGDYLVDISYFCFLVGLICGLFTLILGINYFISGGKKNAKVIIGIVISIIVLSYSLFAIVTTIYHFNNRYYGEKSGCRAEKYSDVVSCYD